MSKLTSPTVDQDLKATGVAQVIVVLNPSPAAAATASAAAARAIESYFCSSERSQSSAVRTALATGGLAAAVLPEDRPALTFPNLGVVLGTVDRAGLAALENSAEVATISGTPQISLIRPDHVAATPRPTKTSTWGIDSLRVPVLWKQGLTGKGVRIAHLDTGVDGKHPTLKQAIAGFAEFELSLGRRITPDPAPHDSGDHGTHTAATIAGRPVQGKHVGVAHGAELFSGLVIEGGNVVARVLGGLDWAIETGVRVVSISLGFRGWWEDFIPIVRILRARGILPVIAAGNEGPGTSRSPGNYPEALSVGAHDNGFNVAAFSSSQTFSRVVDPIVPDLVAPGVNVISARPANRYQSMSGTSMATPHVAGLAALLWEAAPTKTAGEIEAAIFASCRLSGTMTKPRANKGAPDAADAFQRLTGRTLEVGSATSVLVPRAVRTATTTGAGARKTARTSGAAGRRAASGARKRARTRRRR